MHEFEHVYDGGNVHLEMMGTMSMVVSGSRKRW